MTAGGGRPRKPVSHGDDIERDGSAKGLVAVEIIVALRAAEDLREHVAKQQRVLDADVHSLPAGRAVYVCGIPGEEYGTTPIRVGNPVVDPESGAPDDIVDCRRVVDGTTVIEERLHVSEGGMFRGVVHGRDDPVTIARQWRDHHQAERRKEQLDFVAG